MIHGEYGGFSTKHSGSFITSLLISLAGIAGTSLAMVVYHLILTKYCLGRRRRPSFGCSPIQEGPQTENGVEKHVLDTVPILCYSKGNNNKLLHIDQTECVVCLGELNEGDKVRLLPNCRHLFHVPCIDDWFLGHTTCPICCPPIIEFAPIMAHDATGDQVVVNIREGSDQYSSQFLQQTDHEHESVDEDDDDTSLVQSNCLLRRSVSLMMPMEGNRQRFVGLKRSLSKDESSNYVIINIKRENEKASSPSSSSSSAAFSSSLSLKGVHMKSTSYGARSINLLDRMSARLLISSSEMQMGKCVGNDNEILPS